MAFKLARDSGNVQPSSTQNKLYKNNYRYQENFEDSKSSKNPLQTEYSNHRNNNNYNQKENNNNFVKIYEDFGERSSPEKSVKTAKKTNKKHQTPSKSGKSKKRSLMSPNQFSAYSGQKRSKSKGKRAKSKGKTRSSRKNGGDNYDWEEQDIQDQSNSNEIDADDFDVVSKNLLGKSSFKRAQANHQPNPS